METRQFGRRRFLAGTALGAGAAAIGSSQGLDGLWSERRADAASASSLTSPPPVPVSAQGFISRPDIRPPGVSIVKTSAFDSSYPPYIFLTPRGTPGGPAFPSNAQPGLMICDTNGHLVWWSPLNATNPNPFNFRVQTYNGKSCLTWFRSSSTSQPGSYVISDNTYTPIEYVSAVNPGNLTNFLSDIHEFVITAQNTALVTATSVASLNGTSSVICHAQEVDISSGDLVWDWDSSTQVGLGSTYIDTTGSNPIDYFHINSIALWPSTRNYLISSRNTCAIYLVSAQTKEIIWRLGGKYSAWKLGQGVPFWWQHDARPLADGSGISLFDNASQPNAGGELYASGKVLNLSNGSATLRHRFFHSDAYEAASTQGNNFLLSNGGHVVGFGAMPYFSVFAPSSDAVEAPMILDGRFPTGCDSYRTFLYDWVGNPPQSEIGFVIYQNAGNGHWTGHASWNGATEVAAWRVFYGTTPTGLTIHSSAHTKSGFETPIPITTSTAPRYFQAVAYNSAGSVLGRSNVVQISG